MMNILSAKQQSINNDMLQTSLQRDIEYALGKKPSLDPKYSSEWSFFRCQ